MQQFMTGEQMARVSPLPVAHRTCLSTYTRDDIVGEFDFSVEAGSTQPINDTVRKRQAVELMQALAPFGGDTVMDPAALARYVLQNCVRGERPGQVHYATATPASPEGAPAEDSLAGRLRGPAGIPLPVRMPPYRGAGCNGPPGVPPPELMSATPRIKWGMEFLTVRSATSKWDSLPPVL